MVFEGPSYLSFRHSAHLFFASFVEMQNKIGITVIHLGIYHVFDRKRGRVRQQSVRKPCCNTNFHSCEAALNHCILF